MDSESGRDREVRLFPSVRISTEKEAELRAASLAGVKAVSEFGRFIVWKAGGTSGNLRRFTEVSFKPRETDKMIDLHPDGIIEAKRGKSEWRAMAGLKVGNNPLSQEQFDSYHKRVYWMAQLYCDLPSVNRTRCIRGHSLPVTRKVSVDSS